MPVYELRDAVSRLRQTSKCTNTQPKYSHVGNTALLCSTAVVPTNELYCVQTSAIVRPALYTEHVHIKYKTTLFVGNYCFDIGLISLVNVFSKFTKQSSGLLNVKHSFSKLFKIIFQSYGHVVF